MPEIYRLSRWEFFKRMKLDSVRGEYIPEDGKETIRQALEKYAKDAKQLQTEICWICVNENSRTTSKFFFGNDIPRAQLPNEVIRFVLRPDGDEFAFSMPQHVHENLYRPRRQPPVRRRRENDWRGPY
ncbi:MAG: hypothetical protein Q8Q39_03195 [bacterium]|nr:hypothetical protein [bacterium]